MTLVCGGEHQHDIFGTDMTRILQKIQQVQAKKFPVSQPEQHGLPQLLEPDLLMGSIDDGTYDRNTLLAMRNGVLVGTMTTLIHFDPTGK